ncbi:MAG TPA: hypothetical protein VLA58_01490 [Chitinophagaceae bacterium]|nr:hypothetical protein [Chitinophagaceae bacterium]
MKKNIARKIAGNDSDLSSNTDRPVLFVRKKEDQGLAREVVFITKRFRGDLLVYFIAITMWVVGTVWLVIKLIDKFF